MDEGGLITIVDKRVLIFFGRPRIPSFLCGKVFVGDVEVKTPILCEPYCLAGFPLFADQTVNLIFQKSCIAQDFNGFNLLSMTDIWFASGV